MSKQERFEQIFETIAAGVLIQNVRGEITFANSRAQEILRLPREELQTKTSQDPVWHMVLEDGTPVPGEEHPSMITLRTGKAFRNEIRGLFANDPAKVRWLSINTEPIFNEGSKTPDEVVITFADITKLKRTEQRFSQLFDTISSCVAVYEPIDDGEGFVFVDLNPAGEKSSNINKADVIGKKVTEVFPGIRDMGLFNVLQQVHKTGSTEFHPLTRYEDERVEGWVENTVYRLPNGQVVAVYEDTSEQRFAEEALKESEERYRLLFETSQDAIFLADADTGMMLDCNAKGEELIGRTREELRQLHQSELHPPEKSNEYEQKFKKSTLNKGASFTCMEILHSDGRHIPVEISSGGTIHAGGRNVHIGMFRDITERVEAQKELEQTLEATTEGIWSWNLVTNKVVFSPRYYTMLGYEPNEFEASYEKWMELIHPEDRERSRAIVEMFFNSKPKPDTFENEFRLRSKNGEYRYIRSLGRVVERDDVGYATKMIGNHQDVTESTKRESQYSRMLQASVDGFWFTNKDGFLLEVNSAAAEMLGYTVDELQGMNVREIEAIESPEVAAEHIQKIVNTGHDRFETRHKKKDGTVIDVEVSAVYLPSSADNFVVFVRDISERKTAEAERAKLEAQLRQSQKMEAIGRLAGGIAHDFNNLLTTIIGNISLAKMDLTPSEEVAETLQEIDEAAERGAALTRQLLAFSRKQVISPKVISPNELLENLKRLLGRLIGEDIEVRWNLSAEGFVKADTSQMEQVIVNLAVNARDAMPDGGIVILGTDNRQINGEEFISIIVSDDGPGMDEETKARIFEPFFTTKPTDIGTGLGLATVFGIVQQHSGLIEVDTCLGHGTTFSILLPAISECAVEAPPSTREIADSKSTQVVLVVEDDEPVRNIALRILRREGYKVFHAASGPEAIDLVTNDELKIDLLLTDIVMPRMNGKQLADKLIKEQASMKVLYVSGYTEDVIGQHGVLEPGLHFLSKPYRPKALLSKIKELLDS